MHCGNCGVELVAGSAFCPSCGKPALDSAPASSVPAAPGMPPNWAGALCYLAGFISGIFFLVVDPYKQNRFIRFHAFQAIFLSVAWFATYLALGGLSAILPGLLWRVGWILHAGVALGFFLLWVFLMYQAYSNEQFKLPVLGELAAKQA